MELFGTCRRNRKNASTNRSSPESDTGELIVTCIVTPVSILATLYWRGVRSIRLFIALVMVCVSIAAIGASGFGLWYAAQPHVLNLNGPTPLLEFEVKAPAGQSLEILADVEPELDTDRNTMPGYWHTEAPENPEVRAGYVELYFRTSQRLFVLKFPGRKDRIFKLQLPANPMKASHRAWREWQNPDFVAKAGEQPSRFLWRQGLPNSIQTGLSGSITAARGLPLG